VSGSPPPKGGVVLIYENVKIDITDGRIRVLVTLHDGSETGVTVEQSTGEVNKPKA